MKPLAIETELIARLRDRVPQARAVYAAADLAGLEEGSQMTPALHVIYDGYLLANTTGQGGYAMYYERWLVVVAVRHAVPTPTSGAAIRDRAAPLADAVCSALLGWSPDGGRGNETHEWPAPDHDRWFRLFSARLPGHGHRQRRYRMITAIKLLKPHCHAGRDYAAGDVLNLPLLNLDHDSAAWLVTIGVAEDVSNTKGRKPSNQGD